MRSLRLVTQCNFVFFISPCRWRFPLLSILLLFFYTLFFPARPFSYPFLVMRAMFDVASLCIKCGKFLVRGQYTHSGILCVQFWKLRQSEVEPYTLQCRPLRVKYGDLTDPVCAFPSSPLGLSSPFSNSFLPSHRSAIQSF